MDGSENIINSKDSIQPLQLKYSNLTLASLSPVTSTSLKVHSLIFFFILFYFRTLRMSERTKVTAASAESSQNMSELTAALPSDKEAIFFTW